MATYSEMKLSIIGILEHLGEEPNSQFERVIVCEEDEAFILSAHNLEEAEKYWKSLERKVEKNKEKAERMRTKIFSLLKKLNLNNDGEKEHIEQNLSGHSPADLKEVN